VRYILALGLILLTTSQSLSAEIPQDAARMEKRRRERYEWHRRTLGEAYEKVGRKDAKWDRPAREAMELAARMFSGQVDPIISSDEVARAAKVAIDAGCDDPLVVYLHARAGRRESDEEMRQFKGVARAFGASRYPAVRRAAVLTIAAPGELTEGPAGDAFRKEARGVFDAALALVPESVARDARDVFWEEAWYRTLLDVIRGYRWLGMDGPAAYERVDAELARFPEIKALRLRFRGNFWLHYGWEARTNAFAPGVPAGGFETLGERLAVAKKACEEAWKLQPDDAQLAENLMEIDKATGGDRATMELWFERAMKADGNKHDACWSKLDWLDPKWHGTAEEMLAFGRQCRDTKNWSAGITLLCADAHNRHSNRLGAGKGDYLASPEVWPDITSVYDEYLKHFPEDHTARSKYASLAYASRHYLEAHAQFEKLGDNLTSWREFPYVPLETLKKFREYCAKGAAAAKGEPAKP